MILNNNQLRHLVQTPVIAPLVRNRNAALMVSGVTLLQGLLVFCGVPGWPCPFRHALGLPCPGCGLSRAIVALLHNDWQTALTLHAFAPIVLLVLALIVVASVLPEPARQALSQQVEWVERRTGFTALMLVGLLAYWGIRLVLAPAVFIQVLDG